MSIFYKCCRRFSWDNYPHVGIIRNSCFAFYNETSFVKGVISHFGTCRSSERKNASAIWFLSHDMWENALLNSAIVINYLKILLLGSRSVNVIFLLSMKILTRWPTIEDFNFYRATTTQNNSFSTKVYLFFTPVNFLLKNAKWYLSCSK